jgi:hypothetical protein
VAEYLRGGAVEKPETEKILEKLALPQAAPVPPAPAEAPKPAMDERKLAALTQATEPAPSPVAKPAPTVEAKPVDLSKADEKLSSLLGKKQ